MIYQNVFSKPANTVPVANRLKSESEDFDFSQTMLENFVILEESFYDITREHMMATHLSMKEGSVEILQEGFKDFTNSAVEFFKNMIKKFKEFMAKVFMVLHAYLGNFEKFIDKYRDKLRMVNPDFKIQGYKYTFTSDVPKMDKIAGLVNSYNGELEEVLKMKKEDLIRERDEFTSSDQLDNIRSYVLGVSTPIDSEDFVSETKKIYRSGQKDQVEIHIDKAEYHRIVENYKDVARTLKECAKERDKTIMIIESIKDFFSKSPTVHYKGKEKVMYGHKLEINDRGTGIQRRDTIEMSHNLKNIEVVNTYYNFKWVQAKELGSICVTAVTEKVNALKEAIKFYESVVRKGLFTESKPEGSVN